MKKGGLRSSTILWKRKSNTRQSPASTLLTEFSSLLAPVTLWVLLVFPEEDPCSSALWFSCERRGHRFHAARSAHEAARCFEARRHHLVFVDCRFPRLLDPRRVCRDLRAAPGGAHAVLVAVVLASDLENEEHPASREFIHLGFSRYMVETSNVGVLINELVLLEANDLMSVIQLTLNKNMATVISISTDLVYITDKDYIIKRTGDCLQFVNASAEQLLGLRAGADLRRECRVEDGELMAQRLADGCEWTGNLVCRELRAAAVVRETRVFPVGLPGRPVTHYMFVHKPSSDEDSAYHSSRSLLGSRKSSLMGNITSDPLQSSSNGEGRRDSLSLEKELSSPERSLAPAGEEDLDSLPPHSALRRAQLAPLRAQASTTRLSAVRLPRPESPPRLTQPRPSVPPDRPPQPQDDSMPSTLITCRAKPSEMLDQVPVYTAIYELQASLPQMTQLLRNAMTWDFEIFQLEELSEQRPLVHMGLHLFRHFGTAATLACDEATLRNWLVLMESAYHRCNPYHNSTHAADVMQGIAFFAAAEKLSAILDPLGRAACLVAAACHDVDHPGKNTAFLCNSEHPLAYLYNDTSVLEMHHASVTFHLTLSDPRVNILKGLSRDQFKTLRSYIIDMILATEMSKHFDIVQNFDSTIFRAESSLNLQADEVTGLYSPETVAHIKRMMIKCADVSNPTKPVHICTEWALRISEEYFSQTDEEKARNLPVVMPLFDRETCPIPKGQIGFMDFIINDLFKTWTGFVHLPELLKHMQVNFKFWKDLQDQNITTKEEIKSFLNPSNRGNS